MHVHVLNHAQHKLNQHTINLNVQLKIHFVNVILITLTPYVFEVSPEIGE